MKQNNIRKTLKEHSVIPVVSFEKVADVEPTINLLIEKGIHCIEITLRNDCAFECIEKALSLKTEGFSIGIGTVVSKSQIEKATALGVHFMVSPGINEGLAEAFNSSGIPFIPGVSTPSEIILGIQLGWDTFKFFPANLFGGSKALKTYGNVFPSIKFCPTGGISEETHESYLALNNVICVGGSWLV